MSDPILREAIRIRTYLESVAKELRYRREESKDKMELNEYDAKTCDQAMTMLQTLGTEVTRLREAIGCHFYHKLDRGRLWDIAKTWNFGERLASHDMIFVSMPYSDPSKRVVNGRMAIYARKMAEYAQQGELVVGVLWNHFALEHIPGLKDDWETWKRFSEDLLVRCQRLRIIRIDGWDRSEGVKGEIEFAKANGIPVEYIDV